MDVLLREGREKDLPVIWEVFFNFFYLLEESVLLEDAFLLNFAIKKTDPPVTFIVIVLPEADVVLGLVAVTAEAVEEGVFEVSGVELDYSAWLLLHEEELPETVLLVIQPHAAVDITVCEVEYPRSFTTSLAYASSVHTTCRVEVDSLSEYLSFSECPFVSVGDIRRRRRIW